MNNSISTVNDGVIKCEHPDYNFFTFCCTDCGMNERDAHKQGCDGELVQSDEEFAFDCATCGNQVIDLDAELMATGEVA